MKPDMKWQSSRSRRNIARRAAGKLKSKFHSNVKQRLDAVQEFHDLCSKEISSSDSIYNSFWCRYVYCPFVKFSGILRNIVKDWTPASLLKVSKKRKIEEVEERVGLLEDEVKKLRVSLEAVTHQRQHLAISSSCIADGAESSKPPPLAPPPPPLPPPLHILQKWGPVSKPAHAAEGKKPSLSAVAKPTVTDELLKTVRLRKVPANVGEVSELLSTSAFPMPPVTVKILKTVRLRKVAARVNEAGEARATVGAAMPSGPWKVRLRSIGRRSPLGELNMNIQEQSGAPRRRTPRRLSATKTRPSPNDHLAVCTKVDLDRSPGGTPLRGRSSPGLVRGCGLNSPHSKSFEAKMQTKSPLVVEGDRTVALLTVQSPISQS